MEAKENRLSVVVYRPSNFTGGCFEIRFFNVRIAPCAVDSAPESLTLRHLRREIGVTLEINGNRVPPFEEASITLRRDRVDRDSSEVTYVSTNRVRVSGAAEFEVRENDSSELVLLCGSLERVDESSWINGSALENDAKTGWSMDCYTAASMVSGGSAFFQPKLGFSSPVVEVYIAGCCSGQPLILTKTVQVSPRKKVSRHMMLDAIPEDEEIGKDQRSPNGLIRQRKIQMPVTEVDEYEADMKSANAFYSEDMYPGEDGQLTWFNAGVRVGVGIGLGMCLGVGIGVGLMMRSYQATTRNFRRKFF